jgi:hypothetical protein
VRYLLSGHLPEASSILLVEHDEVEMGARAARAGQDFHHQ